MANVYTCEPVNVTINPDGTLSCTNWIESEYTDASNLAEAMDYYLGFDAEAYGAVQLLMILTFMISFAAGKVARQLGRT